MPVVELPEVKVHLNITKGDHDAELVMTTVAAEAAIAERVGPLAATAVTRRVRGGSTTLGLPVTPAISLTSVTPVGGSALTLADLYLNQSAGLVTYSAGDTFADDFYDVVYQAGRATCPEDLRMAVKELVRHMWATQRGGSQRPGSQPSDALSNSLPGSAYVFPFRVEQLLTPHLQAMVA